MLDSTNLAPDNGQIVADRYRLLEPVGAGGMAQVWRGHDEQLDRDVAIKIVDRASTSHAERSAAEREARMAARLVHPNIVRVYDVGHDGDLDFVVMELVSGSPLDELHARDPAAIAAIGAQIADALEHAHRAGVVHCDVKPRNVLVTDDGVPKLLDFGIARPSTSPGETSAEFLGSLPFVAPEQVRGEPLDGRADVYALGATLYQAVTGRAPFVADSVDASLRQRLTSGPPSPRAINPDIPDGLESALPRALAPDPADRFQSAGEFRDALRAAVPTPADAPTQRYAVSPVILGRRRPPRAIVALVLAGALSLALVGFLTARSFDGASGAGAGHTAAASQDQPAQDTPIAEPTSGPTATLEPSGATEPPPPAPPVPPEAKQAPAPVIKKDDKPAPPGQEKKSQVQAKGKHGRD